MTDFQTRTVPLPQSGQSHKPGNRVLQTISLETLDRLRRHMAEHKLINHAPLFHAGRPVQHVWFLESGMISLVKEMRDGRTVEVGIIGTDGVAGVNAVFGPGNALIEMMAQMPGIGWSIAPEVLAKEASRDPMLTALLRGCSHLQLLQIAQTAACNRLHSLEERCCRWLLIAHDNAGNDEFPLTHEFLAMMLGVNRPGVTIAMQSLQQSGYVRYARGRVIVTDRKGLERASCECYATIREDTDKVFRQVKQANYQV